MKGKGKGTKRVLINLDLGRELEREGCIVECRLFRSEDGKVGTCEEGSSRRGFPDS